MKKTIAFMMMATCFIALFSQTATPPLGDGSEGNPYQIATLENLYWLQIAGFPGYAEQTADIDASGTATWFPNGEGGYYGWPAGTCSGNYDGQGNAIDGLYINRPATNYVGLFGNATGPVGVGNKNEFKNIRLTNINITGNERVGGIAGFASKYDIIACSVSGSVSGTSSLGGIVGIAWGEYGEPQNTTIIIQECYNKASVSGTSSMGGIASEFRKSEVINCYSHGSVSALSNSNVGGLLGSLFESNLICCYSKGVVTNGMGLIGASDASGEGGSIILSSYWDYETSGQFFSQGGDFKSTSQMKTQSTYSGWDFTDTWTMESTTNDGYPYLQDNLPEEALPITLQDFNAVHENGRVIVTWRTESETNNAGFLLYRNNEIIARFNGAGTASEPHDYSFSDYDIVPDMTYEYQLADISYSNDLVKHEKCVVTIPSNETNIPLLIELGSNYPNPFNPVTTIPYSLSNKQKISLYIYDMKGNEVKKLVDEIQSAGYHEVIWNGKNNSGAEVNSGVYISLLKVDNLMMSNKMLFVK